MKKILISLCFLLILLSGCTKEKNEHVRRYVFEKNGKISEEAIFTLDENDMYITHLSFDITLTADLLEAFAQSDDDKAILDAYNEFTRILDDNEDVHKGKPENEEELYFNVYCDGYPFIIYKIHYTCDMDLNGKTPYENSLLQKLNMEKYLARTQGNAILFRPNAMRDDPTCIFFPALAQGEAK